MPAMLARTVATIPQTVIISVCYSLVRNLRIESKQDSKSRLQALENKCYHSAQIEWNSCLVQIIFFQLRGVVPQLGEHQVITQLQK
jgi:hypothetical protein